MKIIIAGAGSVGTLLCEQLSKENNDVTLVDVDERMLHDVENRYDILSTPGNCASMDVLLKAGITGADLFIAATSEDEKNLLACLTAYSVNPKIHTIARVMNPDYNNQIGQMRDVLGLSLMINPAKQAAAEIVRVLRYPGFLKRETFAKGRVEIVEFKIKDDSDLVGMALADFNTKITAKVLICAIRRDGKTIIPGGSTRILEGDKLYVTGMSNELSKALRETGIVPKKTKRVLICGGGRVAFYVAQELLQHHIEVQLIEPDLDRCRSLVTQLPGLNVINGDPADENILDNEGLATVDALVTLSRRDELNIITSLYGRSVGVAQVITKLENTAGSSMIEKMDIGSVISPKQICASDIIRYVRAMKNQVGAALSVHSIAGGHAEAMEFRVVKGMPHVGEQLMDFKLKPGVLICCITHAMKHELPNGRSRFEHGDTVIIVKTGDLVIERFEDIFND